MNELLERESPATLVECPVCGGPAELRPGSWEMHCEGCRVSVAIASPDVMEIPEPVPAPRRRSGWHPVAVALTAG